MIPLDTSCEAEYTDGYVHSETELGDVSQFPEGGNVFSDIVHGRLEPEHGPMVEFAVFYKNRRYHINWADTPEGALPVRFRDGFHSFNVATGETKSGWSGMRFGYEWVEDGEPRSHVVEL